MGRNYAEIRGKKNKNFKTGLSIRDENNKRSPIYTIWQNMKQRCLNPKHPKYKRYGGRGIKICDEWLKIEGFYKWAKINGLKKGLSIDRINNDGDYCPENCRVISIQENSRKKRTTKITFEQAKVIKERLEKGEKSRNLAKEFNVCDGTIWFIKNNITHVEDGLCSIRLKKYKP